MCKYIVYGFEDYESSGGFNDIKAVLSSVNELVTSEIIVDAVLNTFEWDEIQVHEIETGKLYYRNFYSTDSRIDRSEKLKSLVKDIIIGNSSYTLEQLKEGF